MEEGAGALDPLLGLLAAGGVRSAVVLRAEQGFSPAGPIRTADLETAALDLPLQVVAVDRPEVVGPLVGPARALVPRGLVTREPAVALGAGDPLPGHDDDVRLSLLVPRRARHRGAPAAVAAIDAARAAGARAAVALLGVDGLDGGRRTTARFWSRNASPPVSVVAVVPAAGARAALDALAAVAGDVLVERVRALGPADPAPEHPGHGRLTAYLAPDRGLLAALRAGGAAGGTLLRAVRGSGPDGAVRADRLLAVRRRAPAVCVVIDRAPALARARRAVESLGGAAAVTWEPVEVVEAGAAAPVAATRPPG
jgi:PII-like signaling protein